jgi:hypothetical protein
MVMTHMEIHIVDLLAWRLLNAAAGLWFRRRRADAKILARRP